MSNETPTEFTATIKVYLYKNALFLAQSVGEAKDGDKVYRLSLSLTSGSMIVALPNSGGSVVLNPSDLLTVARQIESGELKP